MSTFITEAELQEIERSYAPKQFDDMAYVARSITVADAKATIARLVAALRTATKTPSYSRSGYA